MIRSGKARKGDGKDVDHINMNPLNNSNRNLKVLPRSLNRRKQPATKTRRK